MSALILAIHANRPADVAKLLAAGSDPNDLVRGTPPLSYAVTQARPEIVELLLRHGADWRKRDKVTGWTPLMMATINVHRSARRHFPGRAVKDSKRVVNALIAAGAKDRETDLVLGNLDDESRLVVKAASRRTRTNEPAIELDGALVIVPARMARKPVAPYSTIDEYARKYRMTRLLKALLPAP